MKNQKPNGTLPKIGLFSASSIVIANMIGAGIFTTSGLLMDSLSGPLVLLVLWATGGVIALCGALAYAELGAAMPHAGGEYIFLSKLYHPMAGFLSGWVSFVVGFSAPIAASAIGFSEYLFRAFPQLTELGGSGSFLSGYLGKILAILVILIFTMVHLKGLKFGAGVQNFLTFLKIGLILVLIIAGISLGNGNIQHFTQGVPFEMSFKSMKTMGLALMWIMFAYSGWNASTYIGSEIFNPVKNIPRSLILGTGIVIILYLLLNVIYVYALAPDEMKGVISIGGKAALGLFGSSMEIAFSIMIAFALFSSLSAFIILGPRVYYSMAADGYFFKFVSKMHPRRHVPSGAITLQSFIAVLMVISGTFDQILTYMGFALSVFPIMAVAGVIKLRNSQQAQLQLRGYPVFIVVYLLFAASFLVLSYFERPVESSIALVTIISGIPVFYIFKKYNRSKL
jgi:basic amino acid/polyamine antiporter, APA family